MSNSDDANHPMDVVEDSESADAHMFLNIDEEQHFQLQELQQQFPDPTVEQIREMAEILQSDERSVKEWFRRYKNEMHGGEQYPEGVGQEEVYFNPEVEELKRDYEDKIKRRDRNYAKLDIFKDHLQQKVTKLESELQAANENGKILETILEAKEGEIQEKNARIDHLLQNGHHREEEDFKTPNSTMSRDENSEALELLKMEIEEIQKARVSESESLEYYKKELESTEENLRSANKKLIDLEFENGENLKKVKRLRHLLETERVRGDDVVQLKLQKKDDKIQELHDYIEDVLKLRIKALEVENLDYHDSMLKLHHARVADFEKVRHLEIQFQGFRSTIDLLQNRITAAQEDRDLLLEITDSDDAETYERIQKLRKINRRFRDRLEEKNEAHDALQNHFRYVLMEAEHRNEVVERLMKRVRDLKVEKEQWKANFEDQLRQEVENGFEDVEMMNPDGEKENQRS